MYFSATLRYVVLVDDGLPRRRNRCYDSVFIFRARSEKEALRKALKLGHADETSYLNMYKQRVRWAFMEIITLDQVGASVADREVSCRAHTLVSPRPVRFKTKFTPRHSRPGPTF